ncbi:histone acetyltransferases subunit 3-domain-containing protein [Blakeslea trispora]|nr:histone acetyltransferases subunit 3-domain-containing protein [Blakeslea trispora]
MVRVKQKDQVPITTFWSTMDPHFRPLTEEDCAFLMATEQDPKWYDIPPLGRHYTEVWSMENTESRSPHSLKYIHPLADRQLFRQDASCGLLTERVLSSLVKEPTSTINDEEEDQEDQEEDDEGEDEEEEEEEDDEEEENHASDKAEFEERLKQELHYIGLLTEEDIEWDFKEDDEICAELRMVARELKEQHSMNEYRKKKLLNIVGHQLQYEQYQHVLDSLDLQVEQCYIKRIKSKKRKTPLSKSTLSEHAIYAMNKRKAWVDGLEGIFKEKNLIMPIESIYQQ